MQSESNHADRGHAKIGFSPSGIYKGFNCLASVVLERQLPPQEDTEYTLRGTQIHEYCDEAGLLAAKGEAFDFSKLKDDLEAQECVEEFLEAREKIITKIGKDNIVHEQFEERVELTENIWGSADWVLVYRVKKSLRAIIWDHKFGRHAVSPEHNMQAITYALAVREKYPWDQATLIIYQPLSGEETSIKQWLLTKDEALNYKFKILNYEKKVLDVITKGKKAKAVVGDHCQWCRGKAVCTAFKKDVEKQIMLLLDEAPPLEEVAKTVVKRNKPVTIVEKLPVVDTLTDKQRAAILTHMDSVQAYMKAVMDHEMSLQKLGQGLKDWKLVEGRSIRQWSGDDKEVISELKKLGIKEPYKITPKGIGDIETALVNNIVESGECKTKKEAKEIAADMISSLTEKSSPAPKLVPIDDPRQQINNLNVMDMLDELHVET